MTRTAHNYVPSNQQDTETPRNGVRCMNWTEDGAVQSERRASTLAFPSRSSIGEDNRMQAYWEQGNEDGIAAYYNYTAGGERNFKLTSPRISMSQNAFTFNTVQSVPSLVYPTLYASPLITLTKHGYTKHYFEGMNRICSKLGGGFDAGLLGEIEDTVPTLACNYVQQSKRQNEGVNRTFADCLGMGAEVDGKYDLYKVVIREIERDEKEPAFYYHSDHLGSAAYLTNDDGKVTQTLNYLPYGEDWVDVRNDLDPRLGQYTFNGKEKDHESGFHYYGARYYWSELLTGWLSVDPMIDKYPSISPYNYCMWNPVRLVDPTGMDTLVFDKNGVFARTIPAKGEHVGRYEQSSGKPITFTFADPINDPQSIIRGEIKSVRLMKRDEINKILDNSKVFDNIPFLYIYKLLYLRNHSNSTENEGELDFLIYAHLDLGTIYLVERAYSKGHRGHNAYNFGNFLWGASAEIIGVTLTDALFGAHLNNFFNDSENVGKKWYQRKLDSSDDQLSIRHGYLWAFRYAKKPTKKK